MDLMGLQHFIPIKKMVDIHKPVTKILRVINAIKTKDIY